jgi:hypothetical protein
MHVVTNGRQNQWPNYCQLYQKRAEKGLHFFEVQFFIKSSRFPAKRYTWQLVYCNFSVQILIVGAALFRQWPNFLVDLGDKFKNKLATLIVAVIS